MDKQQSNRALALLVCSVLFLMYLQNTWNPYFHGNKPSSTQVSGQEGTKPGQAVSPPEGQIQKQAEALLPQTVSDVDQLYPHDEDLNTKGVVNIHTPLVTASIVLKGGRFKEFLLYGYKEEAREGSPDLNMVEHSSGQPLPLGVYFGGKNDGEVDYRLVSASINAEGGHNYNLRNGSASFVLEGLLENKIILRKTIVFNADSYLFDCKVEVQNNTPNISVELEWTRRVTEKSPTLLNPYAAGEFVWFDGEKTHREVFSEFEKKSKKELDIKRSQGVFETRFEEAVNQVRWITSGDVYFMATIASQNSMGQGRLIKTPELYRTRLSAGADGGQFNLYVGPKKIDILKLLPFELKRNLNIGITAPIAEPMMYLLRFLYVIFGNYGLAIIGFALIARFALIPLTLSTFKQTKAMQALQPEMARMKEQIKDKQQQQAQIMEIYKKHGVNPMGGCLPAFIQLPIFIGLYSALQISFELRHAHFALWINDLSAKEAFMVHGFGVPVMVILFIVSTVLQIWFTPSGDDPQQRMQRKVMIVVLPVMFGFMFASLPAGLTLYFLVNNIIAITQQKSYNHGGTKSVIRATLIVSVATLILGFVLTKI